MKDKQTFTTVTTSLARGDEPSIVISTIALDREHDEIVPEGCDLRSYQRNPVVLFGHDSSSLPVGTTTHVEVAPGRGIRASWKWLEGDEFASRVRNAFDQGVLRAASVGFLPVESERNTAGGRRYTQWQLLEWSLVPTPANPEAVRTLKHLQLLPTGHDGVVLQLRDDPDTVVLTLADDHLIDPADVAAVLPGVMRELLAEFRRELQGTIPTLVRQELAIRRGRVDFDPLDDHRARHQRVRPADFFGR